MIGKQEKIIPIDIQEEMQTSYMDYSMSVIISRALPDVRDGLKPSQRRILTAMNDLSLSPGRAHRKCAKIAGDTSGNYHPHGEQVVYPTLVRMAQNFNMRYPLVDGQGNFGSIDGDSAAAMRYTEARMTHATMEMLADLEKDTVNHSPNYDETLMMPDVLPGKFPNLLCNGSSGIAVGMATNIPPHNLCEVVDACVEYIDNPAVTPREIMAHLKGPDFPTGGIIYGRRGIVEAYQTGRGKITLRARAKIETVKKDRERIIISEIPYMVNKSNLLEKIADLVKNKIVEGISDLRDESDRDGMRIVLELKKDSFPEVVLNTLYKHTQLSVSFGIINLALVENQPKVMAITEMIRHFIEHRHDVVVRRTQFDLKKAEERAHILEGLKIALDNIDEVIELIKRSESPDHARTGLMERFGLSERQAQAILDMRLQRLTGLERKKIEDEYLQLIELMEKLRGILSSRPLRMNIIKEELETIKKKYGDARRTDIIDESDDIEIEDLIAEEDMVVTISHQGYIKRIPIGTYHRQRRGGKGITGMGTKEEDFVKSLFVASTHSYILFFTSFGRCYWVKVFELPQGGRAARGRPIVNMLELQKDEKIAAFLPVREFDNEHFVLMATKKGLVKKTALIEYSRPRRNGINAINILEGDALIDASLTNGTQEIILQTRNGMAIHFNEREIRPAGRTTQGVKGITLSKNDYVVGMVAVTHPSATLLVVCENGYGKRTDIDAYRLIHRGGKGVISIKNTSRNGGTVCIMEVVDDDELIIVTQGGILIRLPIGDIRSIGRVTQGVRLINLKSDDIVVDVERVPAGENDDLEDAGDMVDDEDFEDENGEDLDDKNGEEE
ncbi:MAG: DNA gyrase subunit A [Candidatus Latescibacteria bacterium]|nr:DNA gyrase subunit A [Candidatus Latescibacterota bacterium]